MIVRCRSWRGLCPTAVDRLAAELSVQQRTARRRIDEAVARLVRAAVPETPAEESDAGPAWHVHGMNARLRLDTPTSTFDGLQQGYAYGMAWSSPDGVRG